MAHMGAAVPPGQIELLVPPEGTLIGPVDIASAISSGSLGIAAFTENNVGKILASLGMTNGLPAENPVLVSLTGGGGGHLILSPSDSKTAYGLSVQADVMFTKYFDALFITQRTALYGTVGFDAEFE